MLRHVFAGMVGAAMISAAAQAQAPSLPAGPPVRVVAVTQPLPTQPQYTRVDQPILRDATGQRSNGRVQVTLSTHAERNLAGNEIVRLVRSGQVEIGAGTLTTLSGDVPILDGVDLAGLAPDINDAKRIAAADLKIVTKRQPTAQELDDMLFAFTVAKHVKSNAIVYVKDGQTAGVGAGQMNRRESSRIGAWKAEDARASAGWAEPMTRGSAAASDAFFPFADGLLECVKAGASCVIQPGGSIRDDEVIAAADEAGIAMAFTGVRHFRH